jgi:hypothetical protein
VNGNNRPTWRETDGGVPAVPEEGRLALFAL